MILITTRNSMPRIKKTLPSISGKKIKLRKNHIIEHSCKAVGTTRNLKVISGLAIAKEAICCITYIMILMMKHTTRGKLLGRIDAGSIGINE